MTPFEVLGLPETASADEVKAAFRRLSFSAHPDAGGSAAAFLGLTRARHEALLTIQARGKVQVPFWGSFIKITAE